MIYIQNYKHGDSNIDVIDDNYDTNFNEAKYEGHHKYMDFWYNLSKHIHHTNISLMDFPKKV